MAFTISNNSPAAGHVSWSGLHIQFAGQTFAITDGSTDKVYAWWTPSYPNNLVVSDTFPTLTANDCLVFLNKSGVAVVVPTSTVLDGDLIVPGTVLANALAANSVTADKIAAGAVTAGALAANSVTASAIAADAIGADKIAANAILTEMIVSGAVTTDKLAAASVIANKIAAGAVETAKLAAGAVTADKIDVASLFANSAFAQNLQVSAAPRTSTLPSDPVVGQSLIYTGVTPNEYLQWTGNGTNPTKRRYAATKSGASVTIGDLSDDHALDVTVKTIADQAGSGTPLPSNVRPISGKASVTLTVNGAGYVFAPPHQMLGLPDYPDTIKNDGSVQHQTDAIVLNGSENWTTNPGWAGNAYVLSGAIPHALPVSGYGTVAELMCSHFPAEAPATIAEGTLGIGVGNGTEIYVGFPDTSIVAFQSVSAFKTWLAAHPVVLVYRLETPTTESIAPVEIAGADGVNTITSDGASVTVDYTGSGWAAVGAVQRVNVEAVEITPELGIKVSQMLTDGTNTKNVYTRLYSKGLEIYDADTGESIGGLFMRDGKVFLLSSALGDPRQNSDFFIKVLSSGYSGHYYNELSFRYGEDEWLGDITCDVDVNSSGEVFPKGMTLSSGYGTRIISSDQEDNSEYPEYPIDITSSIGVSPHEEAVNGTGNCWIAAVKDDGMEISGHLIQAGMWFDVSNRAWGENGIIRTEGTIRPTSSNNDSLGHASYRYRRIYLNNSPDVSSDERIKQDIKPIEGADALLSTIPAFEFRMKDDPAKRHYGSTWQAVRDALFAAGITDAAILGDDPDNDGQIHGLLYGEFTGLLIAALAEQRARIAALEARMAALEKQS